MKLWSVDARRGLPADDDPWNACYDKAFGFVVRAETEEDARKLASEDGGDEVGESNGQAWLNPKYSTCIELVADGEAGEILWDFHHG